MILLNTFLFKKKKDIATANPGNGFLQIIMADRTITAGLNKIWFIVSNRL